MPLDDSDFEKLISDVIKQHPGPWAQQDGHGDRGGKYSSIVDAKGDNVLDGEFGQLSKPVFNLLLNFPELAAVLLSKPSGD
jgi:hypothetical protein